MTTQQAGRAPTICAVLITRDEERNLPECLAALAWCDDVIVLDHASRDSTVELARSLGAHVHESVDWPGFGAQKNRAVALARCDWILSIDADERVSEALAREIRHAISSPGNLVAFSMPRLSSYCGQFMRHGGWYPDRVVRLFRRDKARFSDDVVHESLQVTGAVGRLREDLVHISYRSLEDVLEKMNRYSSAGASKAAEAGRRGSLSGALGHSLWAFLRTYVLRRGFLDGKLGFVLACSIAHETWYRWLKLWHLGKSAQGR